MVQTGDDAPQDLPLRDRRTHISDQAIALLKKLSLSDKLKKNKQIDAANQERRLKSLNHVLDPTKYPKVASEEASLITLDLAEMDELWIPSIFERFKDQLTDVLYKLLSEEVL